jgi:hypothetical protein
MPDSGSKEYVLSLLLGVACGQRKRDNADLLGCRPKVIMAKEFGKSK